MASTHRNPLRRTCDRWQKAVTVVLALCAMAVAATAITVGLVEGRQAVREAHHRAESNHQVTAVTTEPAVVRPTTAEVPTAATWRVGDRVHYADLPVSAGSPVGTTTEIWVDDHGRRDPAPHSTSEAVTGTVVVVGAAGVAATLVLLGTFALSRVLFDRHRYRRWDREWLVFDPLTWTVR